jgi:hypothetical protein
MKKSFILLFFLSLSLFGFSQADTISTNLYQKNGKIGIGTNDPNTWLTIMNEDPTIGYATNTSFVDFRRMHNNSISRFQVYGYPNTQALPEYLRSSVMLYTSDDAKNLKICAAPTDGTIQFLTNGWIDESSEKMRITSGGKVGIGVLNPLSKLDVNGSIKIGNSYEATEGIIRWTGTDFEGFDGNSWISFTNSGSKDWIQNGYGLYYDNGNIGIGTESNNHKLSISGNIASGIERNLLHLHNTANNAFSYTGIILKTGIDNYQSVIQDYGMNYAASNYYDFAGFLNLSNNAKGLILHANSASGIIKFYTGHDEIAGAGIERLRITSDGMVGIGTTDPLRTLDVQGEIRLRPKNTGPDSPAEGDIYMDGTDHLLKYYNGNKWIAVNGENPDSTNETSDFLWEKSFNKSSISYTKGKIGIGTDNPNNWLTVENNDEMIGYATNTSIASFKRNYNSSTAQFQIYGYPDTGNLPDYLQSSIMLYATDDARNLKICAAPSGGTIQFLTNGWIDESSEKMRIDSEGNVGIGTTKPEAKLQVTDGDIYISDINKGIIMKSPDGQCWRGVLDNNGQLTFSLSECPENSVSVESSQMSNSNISIYPNPTNESVTIKTAYESVNGLNYGIYNLQGQLLEKSSLKSSEEQVNIAHFKNGVYVLKIMKGNGTVITSSNIIKE